MTEANLMASMNDLTGGRGLIPDRIYFDMDGVLADFDRGLRELAGFVKRYGQGESEEEDDLMWEAVRKVDHFYSRLAPVPGAIELFCDLHALYGERCEILTGIPTPRRNIPEAGDDKVEWVRRLLPAGVKVNVVYRKEKKGYCKGAGSILIDDYAKNTDEWVASGGTGILFEGADKAREKLRSLGIL